MIYKILYNNHDISSHIWNYYIFIDLSRIYPNNNYFVINLKLDICQKLQHIIFTALNMFVNLA